VVQGAVFARAKFMRDFRCFAFGKTYRVKFAVMFEPGPASTAKNDKFFQVDNVNDTGAATLGPVFAMQIGTGAQAPRGPPGQEKDHRGWSRSLRVLWELLFDDSDFEQKVAKDAKERLRGDRRKTGRISFYRRDAEAQRRQASNRLVEEVGAAVGSCCLGLRGSLCPSDRRAFSRTFGRLAALPS
jgi:hypothetical protein